MRAALSRWSPFVLTMDALDRLPKGEKLLLQLYREPFPLYKALANNGFRHSAEQMPDGNGRDPDLAR